MLDLNWVGRYKGWEYYGIEKLSEAVEGTSGLNPRKIGTMLADGERRIVLVDGNLINFARFGKSDDGLTFVYSIKGHEKKFDLIKTAVKAVEIFSLGDHACKDENCLFTSGLLSSMIGLCEACQIELLQENRLVTIVRLLAISSLERQRLSFFLYHNLHVGNAVKDLGIASHLPAVQVALTNAMIDSVALPGSPVRNWLAKAAGTISKQKMTIKARYKSTGPQRGASPPILIASRRWNSWTPNQPVKEESRVLNYKTGGGYFFSDGKTNIAIDPGYGYLDMLFKHGLTVMDLDAIIITHDHPDHLAEAQNILGLRYNYSKQCGELEFYCNPSSYYILSGFTLYYGELLKGGQAIPLFPDSRIKIGDVIVDTVGMFHHEIYDYLDKKKKKKINGSVRGRSKALGLKFTFKDQDMRELTFVVPGDTSFPKDAENCKKLLTFYGSPDVAAIHLGSLEEKWSNISVNASEIEYGENKHLGINGVIHFLHLLKPKLAVITEFGEELDANAMRFSIVELINQTLVGVDVKILPSDVNLFIAFYEGTPHCKCECSDFVPYQYIEYKSDDPNIKYDFLPGCQSGLCHVPKGDILQYFRRNEKTSYKAIRSRHIERKRL